MVLDAFFRRASETFPIPVMLRALLERVFEPARLNDWFEAVTEKQYTRELLFSSAFELMSVVVFKAFGSVHAAYQAKRTAGEITVSVTSVYNKLNGVEAQTSRALVRDTAGHLRHLVEDVQGGCRPWLPGYRVKVLDGNCIAATEHRLQVLRTTAAGPLPGKALVVYDPAVEMAIDVFPCEDGHAQERALLGEVVPTVQAGDLWIMDRNFCVRAFLAGIEARAGTFLCRYHKGLPVTALAPARFVGSIETGKVYEQQVEVLMAPRPGEDADDVRIYRLVRVELSRATRGGDKTLLLLTDLSKSAATGKQVAELYRRRWTIETMFQQLEAHLHSEVNTLGYPAAALFAFCVALVAYNVLAVVKGALRGLHGEQTIHDTTRSPATTSRARSAGPMKRCWGSSRPTSGRRCRPSRMKPSSRFLWGLPGRWIWRSTASIPAGPRSRSPSAPCMPASPTFPPPSSWGRNDDAPTRLGGAQELPARLVLNRGGDYL